MCVVNRRVYSVSFITSLSTAALSHTERPFAGTSSDDCRALGRHKGDIPEIYYYYYHHHHLLYEGIYTYIPETNNDPREYSVAAILLLLFMVLISLVSVLNLLYFYITTFRSMCAVPNMAVFCSSLTS